MFASYAATFALLGRSLREESRARQTYVARSGLIAFMLLLLFSVQQSARYNGAPGLLFFNQIIYLNLWFISLAGLSYFAAAVAEEKEEATLGLLRMTNLGPLTILLGKSTSRLLGVALLLAVQLPFTLLAVTLGGVSTHQILAGYVALGAYIFFLCNLALVFSVAFSRVGAASAMTALALLAFFLVPALGGAFFGWLAYLKITLSPTGWAATVRWLLAAFNTASPATQLARVMRTGFAGPIFGWQALGDVLLGAVCFALAWAGFDRFTRERRESGSAALPAAAGGRPAARRHPRRLWMWLAGRPWRRSVLWKDFFLVHGGLSLLVFRVAAFALLAVYLWLTGAFEHPDDARAKRLADLGQTLAIISLIAGACELALGAARIFRVEIQGKTLSGLAGLPLSLAAVAGQKVGALLLGTLPAALFALGGLLLYAENESGASLYRATSFRRDTLEGVFFTGTQFTLFLCVTAYFSLRLKRLALPLAVAAWFLGNTLILSFSAGAFISGGMRGEDWAILYHIVLLGGAAGIAFAICGRLKALAAAES